METVPNKLAEDPSLPKEAKRQLANAGLKTYGQLRRISARAFLDRAPDVTVRTFAHLMRGLKLRGLCFRESDTIVLIPGLSSRVVFFLWQRRGITRYSQLARFSRPELRRLFSRERLALVRQQMEKYGIEPANKKRKLQKLGFSEVAVNVLMRHGIDDLEKLAEGLDSKFRTSRCLMRELRYWLWKYRRRIKAGVPEHLLPVRT